MRDTGKWRKVISECTTQRRNIKI